MSNKNRDQGQPVQGRAMPGTTLEGSNEPAMNAPKELRFNSKQVGSNLDTDGHYVDHAGNKLLAPDGQPIKEGDTFAVQSRRTGGYHKAGKKFGMDPTEVLFKALTPEQQANLLAAAPNHLVINRSRFTNNDPVMAAKVDPNAKIDQVIDGSGVKVTKS